MPIAWRNPHAYWGARAASLAKPRNQENDRAGSLLHPLAGTAALVQEGGTAPGDGYSSMVNLDSEAIGIVYSAGDKILFQRQPVESL